VKVKYIPYPPLGRVEFCCPDCPTTVIVYSHYPEAYVAKVWHPCPRSRTSKVLVRR